MAFHPFPRTACAVSWASGMQITSLNLEKNGDEGMPRASWCPDTIEPGRKTGLILSKSSTRGGRIYRDLSTASATAAGRILRAADFRAVYRGRTVRRDCPPRLHLNYSPGRIPKRARSAQSGWGGGGADSPAPVGNEVTFVLKLIFVHKGVAASRRGVDAY